MWARIQVKWSIKEERLLFIGQLRTKNYPCAVTSDLDKTSSTGIERMRACLE